jgi:hypothetical protein
MLGITCQPPSGKTSRLAEWERTIWLDEETGEVYVPATATGLPEATVMMMCGFETVGVLMDSGHLYVPLYWVRREYPEERDLWDLMASHAARAAQQDGPRA